MINPNGLYPHVPSHATEFELALALIQCLMQRPVHPSYGRVKQNVDGCLFVWRHRSSCGP